ncbi:MAG: hypothetical protein Q9218_001838 [Villophora microphyllina]
MELWRRLNPHITNADIVARTPRTTCLGPGKKHHTLTQQAFNNRARRDRVLVGTRAWNAREGSPQIQSRLKEVMPNRVLKELRDHGSTWSWRDLTNEEIAAIVSVNRGQGSALLRAGRRRLDDKTKAERDAMANARNTAVLQRLLREKEREDRKDAELGNGDAPGNVVEDEVNEEVSRDRESNKSWAGLESEPPSGSDFDAPETGQWNDSTLLDAQLQEGETLVEPADTDKGVRPDQEGEKKEQDDIDHVNDPYGVNNEYQPSVSSTANETSGARCTGSGGWADLDLDQASEEDASEDDSGHPATTVEKQPAPPSQFEEEYDAIQYPDAQADSESSGLYFTTDPEAVEKMDGWSERYDSGVFGKPQENDGD